MSENSAATGVAGMEPTGEGQPSEPKGREATREHSPAVRHQMRKGVLFRTALEVEVERALRYGRPLALAIIRAERAPRSHATLWDTQRRVLFAEFEDRAILTLRSSDFFARISDRDFAICLPETDEAEARIVAEKLKRDPMIKALDQRLGQGVCGVEWRVLGHDRAGGETAEALLARAMASFAAPAAAIAAEPAEAPKQAAS